MAIKQAEQRITASCERLFNIHAIQRMTGDMLAIRRGETNGAVEELLSNAMTGSIRVPIRSAEA